MVNIFISVPSWSIIFQIQISSHHDDNHLLTINRNNNRSRRHSATPHLINCTNIHRSHWSTTHLRYRDWTGIGIGTIIIVLTLGLGVLPLLLVLHFLPSPLHMMSTGYTSLLTCKARLVTSSGKMRRLDSVLTSAEENNDIPVLAIVNDLCYLSNIAYMLSDFRKMCILGKLPVHFKHIEVRECDY